MWKLLLASLILVKALQSFGATYSTQIHEIDRGNGEDKVLVLLGNGRVANLAADSALVSPLEAAQRNHQRLSISVNSKKEITSVVALATPEPLIEEASSFVSSARGYSPSVLPSYEKALDVFKHMNRKSNEESQCYNRAHVWSWEMYNQNLIRPMKIFIFFTAKYIRKYNFDWWFHVSPYVLTREGDKTIERVMDFKYASSPKKMKEWTDIFVRNHADCSDIEKYTDYEYHRGEGDAPWCMLLRASAYYYQPLDLELLDKKGAEKDFWVDWELRNAYREAFSYRH